MRAMEGVSTSTAGFIGMAERGPVVGTPEFITSFADYKRKFGGYLSENTHAATASCPMRWSSSSPTAARAAL